MRRSNPIPLVASLDKPLVQVSDCQLDRLLPALQESPMIRETLQALIRQQPATNISHADTGEQRIAGPIP